MRQFDATEIVSLLPYPALAARIAAVLDLRDAGQAQAPERFRLPLPGGGVLLGMPAQGGGLAITKLLTVHPANPAQGLPLIQGEILVADASDGRRLGLLDGPAVTARRTAAVSLLAARMLAPSPEAPLLIVGAGVQARVHLEAFHSGLGIRRAYVAARSAARATALADHGRGLGMDVRVVEHPDAVLGNCPLVVTATTSSTPVLGNGVRDDAFVAAVGSFTPQAAELPPELVRRSRLFVDDPEGAPHEAGDYLQAGVEWADVRPLSTRLERPASGPVVFKSVGCALWDLAAALLAFGR